MNKAEKQELVNSVPVWFHSIDCGDGVVTPGHKTAEYLRTELANLALPDLRGKSVLDIGAWDGFYSFAAEERGALRVVALDHYAWSIDWVARPQQPAATLATQKTPLPIPRIIVHAYK